MLREELVRRARALVGNDDAEDVVQDTYARVLARYGARGLDERSLLYAVLRTAAIDHLRRRAWEADGRARAERLCSAPAEDAERVALQRLMASEALAALGSAAPIGAALAVGYTLDECARALGVPRTTIRNVWYRAALAARAALR